MTTRSIQSCFFLLFLFAAAPALQAEDYAVAIKAEKILVTTTAGNGQKHAYLKTDKPEVTAMIVEIPSGAETGWHLHPVPVYAYVLSGVLEVEIAGSKTLTFKQGDAIVEVRNLEHNGRNRGNETVKLVVFYTGEEGRPNATKTAPPAPKSEH